MNYKISASELAICWEAHSMNTNAEELTPQTWTSYRSALEKKYAKTPNQQIHKAAVVSRSAMAKRSTPNNTSTNVTPLKKQKIDSEMEQLEQIVSSNVTQSPQKKDNSSPNSSASAAVTPPSRTSPAVQYGNRKNAGNVVVAYNPHNLDPILSSSNLERTCIITQPFALDGKGCLTKGYKYMTDKNRHAPLDKHLVNMTEAIMEDYDIRPPCEEEDLEEDGTDSDTKPTTVTNVFPAYEHVGVPRQSLQTNIGRICNEAHDGKLNSTSLLLEGTRHGSHGARIQLDVSHLDHYSLFQGQIVAVTGHNLSGKRMVVEKLMEGRMHVNVHGHANDHVNGNAVGDANANVNVKQGDLEQSQIPVVGQGQGAKIYAVAGPYTTSQNLEYQPLTDLLGVVEVEKPDVVIMMGPFVDMRMDVVKNGEDLVLEYEDGTKRHVCYEQFFAAKIAAELEALYEAEPDLKTQFILVPSMDDAVSEPV
jgi:DNA polymerase alpha subunit B